MALEQLEAFRRSNSVDHELGEEPDRRSMMSRITTSEGAAPAQPERAPVPGAVWVDCYYYGFWIDASQAAVYKQAAMDALGANGSDLAVGSAQPQISS